MRILQGVQDEDVPGQHASELVRAARTRRCGPDTGEDATIASRGGGFERLIAAVAEFGVKHRYNVIPTQTK